MDLGALVVDTQWTAGYLAATIRIGAFVVASPFIARRVGLPGRVVFVLAMSLFLAAPVDRALDVAALVEMAVANVVVGVLLGFLTGLALNAFAVAGSLIDVSSGLAIGAVFDPLTGAQSSAFERLFDRTAVVIFFLVGGDRVLVAGLDASTRAVPLGRSVDVASALSGVMVEQLVLLFLAGLEIAAPALAALFLAELVLGLSSRLLPQANVFLVGLPAKYLLAMAMGAAVLIAFPTTVRWLVEQVETAFLVGLEGIRAG